MADRKAETLVISVEEAGAMAGLGRSASYEAARRGEIPVIKLGRLLKVPKALWQRMLNEGVTGRAA